MQTTLVQESCRHEWVITVVKITHGVGEKIREHMPELASMETSYL